MKRTVKLCFTRFHHCQLLPTCANHCNGNLNFGQVSGDWHQSILIDINRYRLTNHCKGNFNFDCLINCYQLNFFKQKMLRRKRNEYCAIGNCENSDGTMSIDIKIFRWVQFGSIQLYQIIHILSDTIRYYPTQTCLQFFSFSFSYFQCRWFAMWFIE